MPKSKSKALCQLMQNPELKRVILALSFSTLRVSELAQVTVDDVIIPTGRIKNEIHLRASLCKRRKPRSVWLSKLAKQMIQEWVDYSACDVLELMIRNIYPRNGFKGCSSHSGRRIMNRQGIAWGVIQRTLSFRSINVARMH